MCATVQEIMNGNHLWNDGMTKGNTICPRPFHSRGIKRERATNLIDNTMLNASVSVL
jgi:hypothetical protein